MGSETLFLSARNFPCVLSAAYVQKLQWHPVGCLGLNLALTPDS